MKSVELDNTRQQELYERAVERMSELMPGWNDKLPSDPAVAVLELASYLSDVQNFEMNKLRDVHYLAYLTLLGAKPRSLAPAALLAYPIAGNRPDAGARFEVDGIPFEVLDSPDCENNCVEEVVLKQGTQNIRLRDGVPILISGEEPQLLITMQKTLPAEKAIKLWLAFLPEPNRIPPMEETPTPISLRCEINCNGTWRETPVRDGTHGFLHSGWLELTPPAGTTQLRLIPLGEMEGAPQLWALVLAPILLEQRHTRSAYVTLQPPFCIPAGWVGKRALRFFLPEGDGWREAKGMFVRDGYAVGWPDARPQMLRIVATEPDFTSFHPLRELAMEEVPLDESGIMSSSLQLMVEEGDIWYDCPVGAPEEGKTLTRGCQFDDKRSVLCFGDGRNFCTPKDGRLLVMSCALTMGTAGNGASGLLEQGDVKLFTLGGACGGQDAEAPKVAFSRAAREQLEPMRAVTCADYEFIAYRAPGLALDRVRAITLQELGKHGAGIILLVKPYSVQRLPIPTTWQRTILEDWLEQYRLVGVPLTVRGPRYLPVRVSVSLHTGEPVDETVLREVIMQFTDGVSGPLDFGGSISYTELFSELGKVAGVRAVRTLELTPDGIGWKRTKEGGLRLEADVLPYLQKAQIIQN